MSSAIRRKLPNEFSSPNGGGSQTQENGPRTEMENNFNNIALGVSDNGSRFQKVANEYLPGQSTEPFKAVQVSTQDSNLLPLSELSSRILVVGQSHESREFIIKKLRNMKLLKKFVISGCCIDDAMQLCNREKYCLVLLDITSSATKDDYRTLCSNLRINNGSPNHSVPIIALLPEVATQEIAVPEATNDTIQLPLTEEAVSQQLLKWAGKSTGNEIPLTPSCPEDDIALAKKAAQIIKETEEQSLLRSQQSTSERPNLYEPKEPFIAATVSRTQSDDVMAFTQSSFQAHEPRGPNSSQIPQGYLIKRYSAASNTKTREHSGDVVSSQQVWSGHSNERIGTFSQDLQQPRVIGIRPHHERVIIQGVPNQGLSDPSIQQYSGLRQSVSTQHFRQLSVPPPMMHQNQQMFIQNQQVITQNPYGAQHQHVLNVNPGNLSLAQNVRPQSHVQPHTRPPFTISESTYNSVVPCWSRFPTPPPEPRVATQPEGPDVWAMSPQSCDSFEGENSCQQPTPTLGSPAYMVSGTPGSKDMKITLIQDDLTKHSSKERLRRERIKESCDQLRLLLPCLSGTKTDMASILEMTVKYIRLVNQRIPSALKLEIASAFCPEHKKPRKKRVNQQYEATSAKKRLFSGDDSPQTTQTIQMRPVFPNDPRCTFALKAPTMVNISGPVFPQQKLHTAGVGGFSGAATHNEPSYQPVTRTIPAITSFDPNNRIMANQPNERSTIFFPQPQVNQENVIPVTPAPLYGVQGISSCTTTTQRQTIDSSGKHSEEMPSQWGFLRLPPINTISPGSSTSNLSPGGSVSDLPSSSSTCSGRTTPESVAVTPPLICTSENGKHTST